MGEVSAGNSWITYCESNYNLGVSYSWMIFGQGISSLVAAMLVLDWH